MNKENTDQREVTAEEDAVLRQAAKRSSTLAAKIRATDPPGSGLPFGIIDPDYAAAFTKIRIAAWHLGYAVTMHGSFTRDLDLVALPWSAHASGAENLINAIEYRTGLKRQGPPSEKEHGRLAWSLLFPGFEDPRWIDFSVFPAKSEKAKEPNVAEHKDLGLSGFVRADSATKQAIGERVANSTFLEQETIIAGVQVGKLTAAGRAEDAMIDSVLKEYGYPANTKNAARAGFVAALRLLGVLPAPINSEEITDRLRLTKSLTEMTAVQDSNIDEVWQELKTTIENDLFLYRRISAGKGQLIESELELTALDWLAIVKAELGGVVCDDEFNCLKAAHSALKKAELVLLREDTE